MKPIRVLHIITGMGSGGAEAYIMNMYRNIDRQKIQFDFLLRSREIIYEEEIKELGGRIYYTSEFPRHFIRNRREVIKFFSEHKEYNIIHVHGNALIYMTALKIAKKHGIQCRIMHSHNTDTMRPAFRILHNFNKSRIRKYATDYFACSDAAGKWMFPDDNYIVRMNGIDIKKFQLSESEKQLIRVELGVENKFVVGNIARFLPAKNHTFILDVFKELHKRNPDSVLILVGSGPEKEKIQEKVSLYNLTDCVRFLGVRKDVNKIFHAFDVFLFPSVHEGLPVVLVECQASGTPAVISNNITDEILLTQSVEKCDLCDDVDIWVDKIFNAANKKSNYEDITQELRNGGFDAKQSAKDLQEYYLNKVSER